MIAKHQAHYIQAFTNYKSSDGSLGVTALQAGIQFKNGLYVGGTFSAAGLPLTTDNITISGTAGNGYVQFGAQTVAPSLGGAHIYATTGGRIALGHSGTSGSNIIFGNDSLTANRTFTAPDKNGTFALVGDNVSEFVNDSGFVVGPGSAVSGRLPSFNGTTGKLIQDSGINIAGTSGKTLTLTGGLTIGADTSIGGGGVITLGGFILTVPATGTVALLGANNVFTGDNSFSSASPLISFVDSGGITAAFGSTASVAYVSANRNPRTGTIYDTGKAVASVGVFAGNGSSYIALNTTQTNNTIPAERMRLINGLSIGGTTDPGAGNLILEAATANLYLKNLSTGFQAATSQIITPQSGNTFRNTTYTSGLVGWNITDPGNAEFNNVDVRGAIHAGVITYNQIQTTAGTFLVTKSAAKLKTDVTIPSSPTYGTTTVNIDVVDPDGIAHASGQLFAVNDVLRLKDGLVGDTWFTVSSASDQTTFWRYVCKIQAGTNNVTYRAGLGVPDFGTSGYGFIMMTADQTNAPYLQMATHTATFTSANSSGTLVVTPQLRLGNLNGSYGYASDIYGLGAGQYGAASKDWFTIDQTNGVRIGNNTTTLANWDISGNILIGQTGASQSNVYITSGGVQLRTNTTVNVQLASTGDVTLGNVATNQANMLWDNTAKQLKFRGSTNGTVVQSYIDTDGSFTAGGGDVKVNANGITINGDSSSLTASNAVQFTSSGSPVGYLYHTVGSGPVSTTALSSQSRPGDSAAGAFAFMTINAANYNGTQLPLFSLVATPSASWAGVTDSNGTFSGMSVGSTGQPSHMLDVYGTGWFQSTLALGTNYASTGTIKLPNTGSIYARNAANSADIFVAQVYSDNNLYLGFENTSLILRSNSASGITISSAQAVRFHAYGAGTLSTDASGNITASSDEKLKTKIRKFRKGLDAIKRIEPILYRWNKKSGLDRKNDYVGFGARHTKRHIPEAVGKGKDGFHTMSDRVILATVVNAIKELEQMYATR